MRSAAIAYARLQPCREKMFVTTQRFAVEFGRRTVGIAVRVAGGFMFYASTDDFDELNGRVFPRARAIERELKKVARRRRLSNASFDESPALA